MLTFEARLGKMHLGRSLKVLTFGQPIFFTSKIQPSRLSASVPALFHLRVSSSGLLGKQREVGKGQSPLPQLFADLRVSAVFHVITRVVASPLRPRIPNYMLNGLIPVVQLDFI
jgi:hypothetical protein